MAVNKVMLLGNVGAEPKVTTLSDGTVCAQFSLATSERAKQLSNGKIVPERTDWHNIVAWRGLAGIVSSYVHKGSKVCVVGKLRQRKYLDKQNIERSVYEVHIDELELLGSNASGGSESARNGGNDSHYRPSENIAGNENFGGLTPDDEIGF